jgi:outer membrane protein assembly factor BamB
MSHGLSAAATRRGLLRLSATVASTVALTGCSLFNGDLLDDWFGAHKDPLPGKREPVLASSHALDVDPAFKTPVTLPAPDVNAEWPQPGRNPQHLIGNLATSGRLAEAWRGDIGVGGGYRRKLTATPLVADGRVFTMDSDANVAAFDLRSGARLWRCDTRGEDDRSTNVGGGISSHGGFVYAATGRAEILAIDAAHGGIKWRKPLAMAARSAPTWVDGLLYIATIDDQMLAVSDKDGSQVWSYQATNAVTSVLGQPAPAFGDGIVVGGFGSGDVAALRADTGVVVWTDSLAAGSGRSNIANLSAVHALPVIDQGVVFAIGLGGLILANDLRSGRRLWERDIAGTDTPCVAGDWIFLITADQQIVALARVDGQVRWVGQLPRYQNAAKQRDPIIWTGPVLTGQRLVAVGDNGEAVAIDPTSGEVTGSHKLSGPASVAPIVAAETLLVVSDDGQLLALR